MFRKILILTGLSLVITPFTFADPIRDNSMLPYKAGWYPNQHRKRFLHCQATCKLRARAAAEYEASGAKGTRRTFVCKVQTVKRVLTHRARPKALYGNQFDGRPVCYTSNPRGKVAKVRRFYCLCVARRGGGSRCPDLVVVKVHKPVWDASRKRSVIRATIKNIGGGAAGASIARVIDPSTKQSTGAPYNAIANTPALAPGASTTVTFYLPYWVFNPDAHLEVTADYKGMVKECNEKNNKKVYKALG